MRDVKLKLPPYCYPRPRKRKPTAYVFMIPPRLRPDGWPYPATIRFRDLADCLERGPKLYQEYQDFKRNKPRGPEYGSLPAVMLALRKTSRWKGLSPKTITDYELQWKHVLAWSEKARHPHVSKMTRPVILRWLSQWDDKPTTRAHRGRFLSVLLQHACDMGLITENPATRLRLSQGAGEVHIWSQGELSVIVEAADAIGRPSMGTAILMAHELGQRLSDIRALELGKHYRDGMFRFAQSKTRAYVTVPATSRLRQRIDALLHDVGVIVVSEETGKPYAEDNFSKTFAKVRAHAGLPHLNAKHLRATHVVTSARAGNTVPEIVAITGHTLQSANRILAHYLPRDSEVAKAAVARIEDHRKGK